ncbi:MAG: pitrilysin family protein [Candidatus Izemoplasma sp.]|nr:pitrilysin family protein [Candidatus Izemoplasma sp.]
MKTTTYKALQETTYTYQHHSGLSIVVIPKPNFHKTYVTLTTPFGANTTTLHKTDTSIEIPLGTAHFLEHKLFDRDGEELSTKFAKHHASVNAYTQNNQTTYLFSCSEDLKTNLHTLIDLVYEPTFTEKGVSKEISVIAEEIDMYQDDPNAVMYETLMDNMYHNHPIKHRVLGTKESITQITPELLNTVHKQYYHPKEMVMVIAGNVNLETIEDTLHNLIIPYQEKNTTLQETPIQEPTDVVDDTLTLLQKDVFVPHSALGAKLDPSQLSDHHVMKQELIFAMLLELIIGKSTDRYQAWIEKGYINDSFDVDITIEQDTANVLFSCNTPQAEAFLTALDTYLQELDTLTFNETDFLRVKKQILGGFIHALNSIEYIANQFTKYHFLKDDLFNILDYSKTITLDDINHAKAILKDAQTAKILIKK